MESKETILDAYEKIMELYNAGELELLFWKDASKEYKERTTNDIINRLCADMKLNYTNYRKDYDILVKLFPQTALKEEEIKELEKNNEK